MVHFGLVSTPPHKILVTGLLCSLLNQVRYGRVFFSYASRVAIPQFSVCPLNGITYHLVQRPSFREIAWDIFGIPRRQYTLENCAMKEKLSKTMTSYYTGFALRGRKCPSKSWCLPDTRVAGGSQSVRHEGNQLYYKEDDSLRASGKARCSWVSFCAPLTRNLYPLNGQLACRLREWLLN